MGTKNKSGKTYISKGERPNVNRKLRNSLRREFRANPSVESILQSFNHRETAKSRPHDPKYKGLKEKYDAEEMVEVRAQRLMDKFNKAGITRAAAIQAVKTDKIGELEARYSKKG